MLYIYLNFIYFYNIFAIPTSKSRILFKACDARDDNWANEVRIRLSDDRCQYDLHTADARSHENCRKLFTNWRNISYGNSLPIGAIYHTGKKQMCFKMKHLTSLSRK